MISTARLLFGLLQPLLLCLLLSGAPLAHLGEASDGERLRRVEIALNAFCLSEERSTASNPIEGIRDSGHAAADGGDDPEPAAVLGREFPAVSDRARARRISCSFYATAPPSHRACAAPPTGPPFLV